MFRAKKCFAAVSLFLLSCTSTGADPIDSKVYDRWPWLEDQVTKSLRCSIGESIIYRKFQEVSA